MSTGYYKARCSELPVQGTPKLKNFVRAELSHPTVTQINIKNDLICIIHGKFFENAF